MGSFFIYRSITVSHNSWNNLDALHHSEKFTGFLLSLVVAVFLFILPIVNHVGIFIAIRRHYKHVVDAVSGQDSAALIRREKRVAIDMIIVMTVLLFSLVPAVVVKAFQHFIGNDFEVLYIWTQAIVYLNSSINPVIYFVRSSEIRSAIRSMIHC